MTEAARTSETPVDIQLRTRQYIAEDSELEPDIVKYITINRLGWTGHVRMDNNRTVNKVFNTKPIGLRRTGRPKLRRENDVIQDIKTLEVKNYRNMEEESWQKLEEGQGPRRDVEPMMMMMMMSRVRNLTKCAFVLEFPSWNKNNNGSINSNVFAPFECIVYFRLELVQTCSLKGVNGLYFYFRTE
jgi:hypothetical protein